MTNVKISHFIFFIISLAATVVLAPLFMALLPMLVAGTIEYAVVHALFYLVSTTTLSAGLTFAYNAIASLFNRAPAPAAA